jgi:hypothetical protein
MCSTGGMSSLLLGMRQRDDNNSQQDPAGCMGATSPIKKANKPETFWGDLIVPNLFFFKVQDFSFSETMINSDIGLSLRVRLKLCKTKTVRQLLM